MSMNKKERAIARELKLQKKREKRRKDKQLFEKLVRTNNWIELKEIK